MNAIAAPTRVRRFQGRGVEIVADEAGPAGATPVILLHGGGQTRGAWGGALAEGARRGFHMLSADLRGHGESGWRPTRVDLAYAALGGPPAGLVLIDIALRPLPERRDVHAQVGASPGSPPSVSSQRPPPLEQPGYATSPLTRRPRRSRVCPAFGRKRHEGFRGQVRRGHRRRHGHGP